MFYRPFRQDDFAALFAVEEQCFAPPFRFSRAYMQKLVRSTSAATWIAEQDGAMAGFAIVEWEEEVESARAYIQTIEVAPAQRRLGVGGELMRRVEASAVAAGAQTIWLHVDAENESAIHLYEAHGYGLERREANYYPRGRAALVYVKAMRSSDSGAE
jgi:ribosomal-protein-alanine N-acetyltransferase